MSSTTTNYGLHLTDDSSERFLDWRTKMNGTQDSNMVKIDTALGEKANSSIFIESVLLVSSWLGDNAPFTQEVLVEGLSAEQNGTIALSHSATAEQRSEAREAVMSITGQENGKLIISADGKLPEVDIPISIVLLG